MSSLTFSPEYAPDANLAVKQRLLKHAINREERSAIEQTTNLSQPPPTLRELEVGAVILEKLGYVSTDTVDLVTTFASRNTSKELQLQYLERCFPTFHFVRKLFTELNGDVEACRPAIELIWRLQNSIPPEDRFSKDNYYEHHLALRIHYKRYFQSEAFSRKEPILEFDSFLETSLGGALIDEGRTTYQINTCLSLIDKRQLLGERLKEGNKGIRPRRQRRFSINKNTSVSLSPELLVQSAKIDDEFLEDHDDDTATTLAVQAHLPLEATSKDKRSIFTRATRGFERRNVPCRADMQACSVITYSGYLSYAFEHASPQAYALTWLSAFVGFDASRPIRVGSRDPVNEEALLDSAKQNLTFNVIRRVNKKDITEYETAGVMHLALPSYVCEGLRLLSEAEAPEQFNSECDQVSKSYANSNPGIRPTLPRLRNSGILFVGLSQMTHLELGALTGRVPPSLKGVSAYYSLQSKDLNAKFHKAYETVLSRLNITAPLFEENRTVPNNKILLERSYKMDSVGELLTALGDAYAAAVEHVERRGVLVQTEEMLSAIQVHEVARYVLQQTFLGVRPIGEVANLHVSSFGHVLVCDKSSRLFSERSYTPISDAHRKFLNVSERNKSSVTRFAQCKGLRLIEDEPRSDLAQKLSYVEASREVSSTRLTNAFFRSDAPIASSVVDPLFQNNWMRKVAANSLWKHEAQWILDEFLGHRRIGREPFGTWSTVDARKFQKFLDLINDVVIEVLDPRLLHPIRLLS